MQLIQLYCRLIFKEIWLHRSFTVFFIANMGLGLVGLSLVQSLGTSLNSWLSQNSRQMLGADLMIESEAYIPPRTLEDIRLDLPSGTRVQTQTEFFSMLGTHQGLRMVQVLAVDNMFPLYGKLALKCHINPCSLPQPNQIYMSTEAVSILDVTPKSNPTLSGKPFEFAAEIVSDPTASFSSFGIAPRVLISKDDPLLFELLGFGSRARYQIRIALVNPEDLLPLEKTLKVKLKDTDYRIVTHQDSNRQLSRLTTMISDFLGLMAAAVLFLAACGLGYLYQSRLRMRLKDSAIFMTLGATPYQDFILALVQIGILGFTASLCAILITPILLPGLTHLIREFLPPTFLPVAELKSALMILGCGVSGSVLLCLPSLLAIFDLKPGEILLSMHNSSKKNLLLQAMSYILILFWFYMLCVWQSNSYISAAWFVGGLALALILLIAFGYFMIRIMQVFTRKIEIRLALLSLSRRPWASLSCFAALSLAVLLLVSMPEVKRVLQTEIDPQYRGAVPSLFLFDIQPEQRDEILAWADSQNVSVSGLSGMVRARLLKVNGAEFLRNSTNTANTREAEREQFFRRRSFNLSYRLHLSESETIVEGKAWNSIFDPSSQDMPLASLEEKFAERLKLKVGDVLEFDIHGVVQKCRIANFRQVRWNSFEPNFFALLQPGVLEDAPQTYLAAIRGLSRDETPKFQASLQSRFDNISSVDVGRLAQRIRDITDKMSLSMEALAWLALLVGLLVLLSIASHEASTRKTQTNLLKVLGGHFYLIRRSIAYEFGILALLSALAGGISGLCLAWLLALTIFSQPYFPNFTGVFLFVVFLPPACVSLALIASNRVLKSSPAQIFQESQYSSH
ncbi:MAG: hypothetical protein H3C47_07640 [Candidatus Cloacimonetes bacterium]|nr:hypothetical protein [Candidatus Cloacimonadota bacterium]